MWVPVKGFSAMTDAVDLKSVVKHIVDGTFGENLCRICLLPFGNACENIFTKVCKVDSEYCIADILQEVCHAKFTETDKYNVCSDCFLSASAAYKFYLLCQRSNQILDFYVNELVKNVDLIQIPEETTTDSLCITLPDFVPEVQNFDYNTKFCKSKQIQLSLHDILDKPKTHKRKILSDEKTKLDHKTNSKQTGGNEDFVIIVSDKGEPMYYKINSNGELELASNSPSPTKKVRRKRVPMTFKQCSRCPVKYRFMAKMKEHMKLDHNADLFICKLCKETTEDEQDFNNHLRMHTNIHRCALCSAVFKKRDTIIAHLKWHEEMKNLSQLEGAHVCEQCGIMLPNEAELADHYDKKHDKKYTCFYCGKMYRGELSFEMHIKKHEMHMRPDEKRRYPGKRAAGDAPAPAPSCPRRWACAACGRSFVDERALKWHTMLHTNDRPFKCDVCGRGFVSVNRRNQHAVCAHTAPARRCPLCPALFHLRSMVNTHIKKVHLKAHKRRNRTSKHQNVFWRTEPVPIQELSVSIQNEIIELRTAGACDQTGAFTYSNSAPVRLGGL